MFLWENAEKFGNLAQLVLTAAAVIALGFAYLQVRSAEKSQREATAKEIYRDYLMVAFENPELASPDDDNQKIIRDDKYRWFVAVSRRAWSTSRARSGVAMSPLATTGTRTAAFTAAMVSYSASPL